jgi:hypothetical protein
MRVDKSFRYACGNIISSQLSSTLMHHATLVLVLTGGWELRKLSCKLSLLNSHQLSCNSCSRFDRDMRVEKTLIQTLASQLSSTLMQLLFSFWSGHESWENSHTNSRFSTLINSHATLVLIWPGHKSWENSHANSRFSTLISSHATLVLVWPKHESMHAVFSKKFYNW